MWIRCEKAMRLSKRLSIFCSISLVLLLIFTGMSSAETLYVDDDGGAGVFLKIQEAVDAASAGDVIIVREGTYIENVDINKSITIHSEKGYEVTVVEAADPSDHVFDVTASGVNISGLTMKGATEEVAGIYVYGANNCNISDNNVNTCTYGISLNNCSNCVVSYNIVNSNEYYGIYLKLSNHNALKNNTASKNWDGLLLSYSTENMVEGNIASNNNFGGITLMDSSGNFIVNNTAKSNYFHGFYLQQSNNNSLKRNTASLNMRYGIHVLHSSENGIWQNNFVMNMYNVRSSSSTNIWNSTDKMRYIYDNETYENYMGNHWGDYEGGDSDGDGIGDIAYIIDSDRDNYPLMEPFENYKIQQMAFYFDTGTPENPYPSIFGLHKGTIIPNKTITVSKLYTYACPGTGGHSEHVEISNVSGIIATGRWSGYAGDWHYIEFDRSFLMKENEIYNYTIKTGSYPQIIHENKWEVECGKITCTEFVDANNKRYNNWIPAIRLE